MVGYNLGDPPSSKSEVTTGFPASKYMYKLVFTLSETFTRPLHEAIFHTDGWLQAGAHTLCIGAVQAPSKAVGTHLACLWRHPRPQS